MRLISRGLWEIVNSFLFTGSSAAVHAERNEAVVTQMICFSGVELRTVWENTVCLNAMCEINLKQLLGFYYAGKLSTLIFPPSLSIYIKMLHDENGLKNVM